MKQFIICLIALATLTISCSQPALDLNPDSHLSTAEQLDFKIDLARYIQKLPSKKITMEMRWDSSVYDYYKKNANSINLVKMYKSSGSTCFFYITKITPSVRDGERKAIAGKCNFSNKRISNIEEIFISTTESSEVLEEHAEELLTEVIKTNKAPVANKLVEWPNQYFYYNKGIKEWDRVPSAN